jgi:3-oxoacyl-[acyl-carrier-protein] synthase II
MGEKRRVVVTGMGQVTVFGETLDSFWTSLIEGKSGVKTIENFDTSEFPVKIGGEICDFDTSAYLDKRETKRMDRFAQFAVVAAVRAFNDSGLELEKLDRDRCGVIVGSGIGGLAEISNEHRKLMEKGPSRVSPFCVPRLMVNACSANIAIYYKFRGANTSVVTACASAAHAMGDAYREILRGSADIVVSGGSEAALIPLGLASFCSLKALSTRNDEPQRASRPFDRDRDGFVFGEGAGILILEDYEHAKKRGARIYAEMNGFGMSCDGGHITAPSPCGEGAVDSMNAALRDADLQPEQIDYINAHGTGTPLNDSSETMAMKTAFNSHAKKIPISSTKSHLGHLLGASGGVEAIACALAITHSEIPPTINLENPDENCDLDYVPLVAREKNIDITMSNSFGFGGHNATVILRKV